MKNLWNEQDAARYVTEMVAEMCGPLLARTTATQVPVDGGNERVI